MITRVHVREEGEWWLIEEPKHFIRRWMKALRKGRFFLIKYAGLRLWINPHAVMYVEIR